jgi:hypothetical protein
LLSMEGLFLRAEQFSFSLIIVGLLFVFLH